MSGLFGAKVSIPHAMSPVGIKSVPGRISSKNPTPAKVLDPYNIFNAMACAGAYAMSVPSPRPGAAYDALPITSSAKLAQNLAAIMLAFRCGALSVLGAGPLELDEPTGLPYALSGCLLDPCMSLFLPLPKIPPKTGAGVSTRALASFGFKYFAVAGYFAATAAPATSFAIWPTPCTCMVDTQF